MRKLSHFGPFAGSRRRGGGGAKTLRRGERRRRFDNESIRIRFIALQVDRPPPPIPLGPASSDTKSNYRDVRCNTRTVLKIRDTRRRRGRENPSARRDASSRRRFVAKRW